MIDEALSSAIAGKLAKLGDTSEEVAAALEAEGCAGRPGYPEGCPVAKYLNKIGWGEVSVGAMDVAVFGEDDEAVARFDLPESLRLFIADFDGWVYPRLLLS
jgi:hypothetical protein